MFGIFNRWREKERKVGYLLGEQHQRSLAVVEREERELAVLKYFVNKPVIQIPNEWANPIIGFGKRIETITRARNSILLVENAFTGEEVFCLSTPIPFSEQRLIALSKLDPFERWALKAHNSVGFEDFDKERTTLALSGQSLLDAVRGSTFWTKWLEFKQTEEFSRMS